MHLTPLSFIVRALFAPNAQTFHRFSHEFILQTHLLCFLAVPVTHLSPPSSQYNHLQVVYHSIRCHRVFLAVTAMDDNHHADARAYNKPRHDNLKSNVKFSAQRVLQPSMKQSQILTPPNTPPRSSHSSMSTTPNRNSTQKELVTARVHFDLHMSLHRSASMSTNFTDMSESSLWTLPGLDDGEPCSASSSTSTPANTENRWSRLLQSAASSNRERHRARLEGDGWAFVGGRYSDECQELSDESAESVDEEFDVVVLAREAVGC